MTLEQAIEYAAGELPEGWTLTIEIRRGLAIMDVIREGDPHGPYVTEIGDCSRTEEIMELVRVAQTVDAKCVS